MQSLVIAWQFPRKWDSSRPAASRDCDDRHSRSLPLDLASDKCAAMKLRPNSDRLDHVKKIVSIISTHNKTPREVAEELIAATQKFNELSTNSGDADIEETPTDGDQDDPNTHQ